MAKRTEVAVGALVATVAAVGSVALAARGGQSGKYDALVETVTKLKVGQMALLDVPAKADKGLFRFNVGSAMRRLAQPKMSGRLLTRLSADGTQVAVCHLEKGTKAERTPQARAASRRSTTKAKAKPKTRKTAAASAAMLAVPATQPTFDPTKIA